MADPIVVSPDYDRHPEMRALVDLLGHTHRTWLAEDGVAEVARAARPGHRMRGMGDVYDNVTPAMKEKVREALEERWRRSLHSLKETEREWIVETVPRLGEYYRASGAKRAS